MNQYKTYIAEQAKIFKALGHPTRLMMVDAMRNGEKRVCELKELVGDDMSTISRHLSVLKEAGIVSFEKRGINIYYKLKLACVESFLSCTSHVIEQNLSEKIDMLNKH